MKKIKWKDSETYYDTQRYTNETVEEAKERIKKKRENRLSPKKVAN